MSENDGGAIGPSDESVRAMQAFLRLTDRDGDALRESREAFANIAPDLIVEFYEHLNAQPASARFLQDPALVAQLKNVQLGHFVEFFSGDYNAEYFRKRLDVGRSHERIGLEPQWAIGAYNVLLQLALTRLSRDLGTPLPDVLLSLIKVFLLDAALSVQAYHVAAVERLQRRNAELERALQLYYETELKAEEFARLAGHEIRNSLNAIANACDEVAEDFADRIPREAADTLKSATERSWQLVDVVEQILAAPDIGGTPQWVEATEIINMVRDRVPLHTDGKAVQLQTFDAPVRVWAEPVGLREVFSNLVANAIHHLDKPHGTVKVEHEVQSSEHVFAVTDNGPGIPAEFHQQVFQPFYRGEAADERAGKGLGLHFVRTIVERHGGRVWMESEPGSGSRFSFSLPREPRIQADWKEAGGAK